MNKHLVLVGMMGSGKTTTAQWLHHKTDLPVYDLDAMIEKQEGKRVFEIFTHEGEPHFRSLEQKMIGKAIASPIGIIATGGGLFIDPTTRRRLLHETIVFYLKASVEELLRRVAACPSRPLARDSQLFRELLASREVIYRTAHHIIPTEGRTIETIGDEILKLYKKS